MEDDAREDVKKPDDAVDDDRVARREDDVQSPYAEHAVTR